ncbi:MAG: hypothetical protein Fur0010_07190 [Bdellovibrio sp.]
MMRKITLALTLLCSLQIVQAKDYIVVGVAGFATKKEGRGQPSGVHDHLPIHSKNVRQYFKLVHFSNKKELQEVVDQFDCREGVQPDKNLGLILMINSWGAGNGEKLAEMYFKQCGRKADVVYLIDGVAKPIGPFKRAPIAHKCFSFYQTKGVVHGEAINGCESTNYTEQCEHNNYGPIQCHIAVEWWGAQRAEREILKNYLR